MTKSSASSSTTPASLVTGAAPNPITLPEADDNAQRFLAIALKTPAGEVIVARVDINRAVRNALVGVESLADHRDQIATFPGISLEQIDSIADMGHALQYFDGQVENFAPIPGETRAKLAKAHQIRTTLLNKAAVLVDADIIPAAVVEAIRKGRGAFDAASDCVALGTLFHQFGPLLDGHVKVTDAEVQAASTIGSELLAELRPADSLPARDKELAAATDARDRVWTLFEQTWEQHVWKAGAWLFGRDVDDHVPPLRARTGHRVAKPTSEPTPTPAPTPEPTPAPVATTDAKTRPTGE